MTESKISSRYASSFLGIAIEKKILERAESDMKLISGAFSSRELKLAIDSPIIKPEIKKNILSEIFSGKVDAETIKFINFVISKGRESLLPSIADTFLKLMDEHVGVVRASVTSAFEFSEEQKAELSERFETMLGKKVYFKYEINAELIGGFIVKINDTIFDASVFNQLSRLRNHFVKAGITLN